MKEATTMLKWTTFFGTLAALGFLLGAISGALAAEMPAEHITEHTQFRRIEQPLGNKLAVTATAAEFILLSLTISVSSWSEEIFARLLNHIFKPQTLKMGYPLLYTPI
jgi:hypothetical protein